MSQFNDLLMPKLGLTMTEGTLVEWAVAPGDVVRPGDVLFIVETEKVANEVSAEADGVIGEILVQSGETVVVGTVVGRWTGPGQSGGAMEPAQEPPVTQASASSGLEGVAQVNHDPMTTDPTPSQSAQCSAARIVATPLARRLAREQGVDLHLVRSGGPGGRIKAVDVRSAAAQASLPASMTTPGPAPNDGEHVSASGLVQSMARRMTQAKQVPHFYLSSEAEVSELMALRCRLNAMPDAPKLTLNHFVIAAVARALESMPHQNRIWQDDHIVQFRNVDVGIAVSTGRGLMAPILHDLGGTSIDDIALRSNDLIARVKAGKTVQSDMTGGALTISNAGMFNVTYMTPIINPPQSAILGVGSIRSVFRPDAEGAPALRREMGLVLAADHRLHDGASALAFLNLVIELLQEPYRLLRTRPHTEG